MTHWQVDDGQYVLELDVSISQGQLRVVERRESPADSKPTAPHDWFSEGLRLESADPPAARHAYQRAVDEDPLNLGAWINLGRLLHELQAAKEAESVYQQALQACGLDALLLFNLGVVLEDLNRPEAALQAYQSALEENPDLADCHYNLARLHELLGRPQHAIRHLGQYRRLLMRDGG
jgi:tetratricopeptide (TPR) repeat protein